MDGLLYVLLLLLLLFRLFVVVVVVCLFFVVFCFLFLFLFVGLLLQAECVPIEHSVSRRRPTATGPCIHRKLPDTLSFVLFFQHWWYGS